jgi:hypothetical protein
LLIKQNAQHRALHHLVRVRFGSVRRLFRDVQREARVRGTSAGSAPGALGQAVAASTLAAAALFNPRRRRVQKVVDRRFNRASYDAEQTAAARLKEALELDPVRDDLAGVVQLTLEPPTSRYRSGHQTELAIADRNQ